MALSTGTRLGAYEITAMLGAGGMGEVYRARDTKLNRDVALKVLPEAFTHDADRLARFKREAQVLASLNHPHIAAIYGLEEANGSQFLVLELVEGETLAARLKAGPIPLTEALTVARQVAEACQAAHEKGIVHRDLKPANIAFTADDQVKVLDFGLAKALEPTVPADVTNSPTISLAATRAGVILGTAAYMSPEQAKGRDADKRSDVWAFGCVLYEMLAGRRAFEGEDLSDTLANVLKSEPDWSALPSNLPAAIHTVIRRSLDKDRKQRIAEISTAHFLLTEHTSMASTGSGAAVSIAVPQPARWRRALPWAVAAGALTVAGFVLVLWAPWRSARPPQPMRFAIVLPAAQPLAPITNDRVFAISPDATHLAYVVGGNAGTGGQLMVHSMNRLEAEPLRSITGARAPFFSPDGKWIGFFEGQAELRKVSVDGGTSILLCRFTGLPRGASWSTDGTIVFATSDVTTGLLSVPAGGGEPKVLTKPDPARGEQDHLFPLVLPGGRAVLFTITGLGAIDTAQIVVLDLSTGQQKTLVRGATYPEFVDLSTTSIGSRRTTSGQGYLVYAVAGTLRAVRFDPARLEVTSDPVPVADQVAAATSANGAAEFAVSRTGTLAYVPGTVQQAQMSRSLVWVNRQGREEAIAAPPRAYVYPRLSPDGTRIALDVRDQQRDIWIWDLRGQTMTRMTSDPGFDTDPVWTPDGQRVIFSSSRAGVPNLFWQAANGTGTAERLTTSPTQQWAHSISTDGSQVVLDQGELAGTSDIGVLLLQDGSFRPGERRAQAGTSSSREAGSTQRQVKLLVETARFTERNPVVSADGRWLAYQSNESGAFEIYVRPFPNVEDGRWSISRAGGTRPVWARDGRELFYLDGNGVLTTVPVQTIGAKFVAGGPAKVFDKPYVSAAAGQTYDVSPDGQRFLMIKDAQTADQTTNATSARMVVVLNWVEELKARLPDK